MATNSGTNEEKTEMTESFTGIPTPPYTENKPFPDNWEPNAVSKASKEPTLHTRQKPLAATTLSTAPLESKHTKSKKLFKTMGPKELVKGGERTYKIETRIVLMGEMGSGKSSTGNMLLGQKPVFIAKPSKEPVTKKCNYGQASLPDRDIAVIDTPGCFGIGMPEDMKTEIAKCYGLVCPGPHAILLTIPVDTRHSKDARAAFDQILGIFGEEVKKYVLLVFTKADQLKRNFASEKFFLQNKDSDLAYILQECEDRYVFVDNTVRLERAIDEQRNKILSKIDKIAVSNLHFENEFLTEVRRYVNNTLSIPVESEQETYGVFSSDTESSTGCRSDTDSRERTRKNILDEKPGIIQNIVDILRYLWKQIFTKKSDSQTET